MPGGCGIVSLGLLVLESEPEVGVRAGSRQIRGSKKTGMTVFQPEEQQISDCAVRFRSIGVCQTVCQAGLIEEMVEIAKQERKQAAAKDKQNTKLWSIYTKYFFNDNINRWASADTFLTKREIATLENSNISTEHSIFNILCEIRNKITNK